MSALALMHKGENPKILSSRVSHSKDRNTKTIQESSSEEEEYSFFTDSSQVHKTECLWLGNQASDAESTDSEDENPLDHAGVWTVEECVNICKEKMSRLRFLYAQQYKRLNYHLREEKRKMLNEFSMDPYMLSKVGFEKTSGNDFQDYIHDVNLTNYQRASSGVELIAEKQMKDKRNKGVTLHNRRSDLPRCQANKESIRCSSKVLPFSRFCYQHVCSDAEQFLYTQCTHRTKSTGKCTNPTNIFARTCDYHIGLHPSASTKPYENFQSAKKARETRKRKLEENLKKEKEIQRNRRTSVRHKDDLKSPPAGDFKSSFENCFIEGVNIKQKDTVEKTEEDITQEDNVVVTGNTVARTELKSDESEVLNITDTTDTLINISDESQNKDESGDYLIDVISDATLSSEEVKEFTMASDDSIAKPTEDME